MKSKCWKFGDDVNTDEIIPARYLNSTDPEELAAHCMEDADPQFTGKAQRGDIIAAGKNFGCGSSREHAPLALKGFGISCVIAESFARIFFRNAVNTGLPIAECPEAASEAAEGDVLEVSFKTGTLFNHTRGLTYSFPPFPEEITRIIESGGLMASIGKSSVNHVGASGEWQVASGNEQVANLKSSKHSGKRTDGPGR